MKKTISLLAVLVLAPVSAHAENARWWQFWRSSPTQESLLAQETARTSLNLLFTEDERRYLGEYLRSNPWPVTDDRDYRRGDNDGDHHEHGKDGKGKSKKHEGKPLPPGLQKKVERGGQLPPGWQKKVQRGEVIDGHLYSRAATLPPDIYRRLRQVEGTEVRRIDDRIFRVMLGTREILDVLSQ